MVAISSPRVKLHAKFFRFRDTVWENIVKVNETLIITRKKIKYIFTK